MYFSYKQAKLVRAVEPKSKIWGVLGGYPLITGAYRVPLINPNTCHFFVVYHDNIDSNSHIS